MPLAPNLPLRPANPCAAPEGGLLTLPDGLPKGWQRAIERGIGAGQTFRVRWQAHLLKR